MDLVGPLKRKAPETSPQGPPKKKPVVVSKAFQLASDQDNNNNINQKRSPPRQLATPVFIFCFHLSINAY